MAKLEKRYAVALMMISEEKNTLEQDLEQVTIVHDAIEDDDVQNYLVHPYVPKEEKKALFSSIFQGELSEHVANFFNLMIDKNRERLILPALADYIKHANKKLGRVAAMVVSAKKLTDEQLEAIRKTLSRQLNMEIDIRHKVDPDVLGGFYILVDEKIYDATIRTEINNMRKQLRKEVINGG